MTEQELREKLDDPLTQIKVAAGGLGGGSRLHITKAAEAKLMQLITQYGDQRETEIRIDEVVRAGASQSTNEGDKLNIYVKQRIAELKAKEVK